MRFISERLFMLRLEMGAVCHDGKGVLRQRAQSDDAKTVEGEAAVERVIGRGEPAVRRRTVSVATLGRHVGGRGLGLPAMECHNKTQPTAVKPAHGAAVHREHGEKRPFACDGEFIIAQRSDSDSELLRNTGRQTQRGWPAIAPEFPQILGGARLGHIELPRRRWCTCRGGRTRCGYSQGLRVNGKSRSIHHRPERPSGPRVGARKGAVGGSRVAKAAAAIGRLCQRD